MSGKILGIGIVGTELTDLERRILIEQSPYAVVLFGRNVESAKQLCELTSEITSLSAEPPLIMIDQEGGRVDRLRNLIPGLPSAAAFEDAPSTHALAREFGEVIGNALAYFNCDINLAPVVDIRRPDLVVPGMERRAFGSTAEDVTRLVRDFLEGQHSYGAAACLKHFPGIGLGSGDPHYGASVVHAGLEQLEREDLVPYRELGNLAGGIMIGHGSYPAIEDPNVPASLSYEISTRLLRERVGFEGTAVSDDMEMHAVADLGSFEEIAVRAIRAGNDVVLFCSQIERVPGLIAHIEREAESDSAFADRLTAAIGKAGEYREHCRRLKRNAKPPAATFGQLEQLVVRFCNEFTDAYRKSRGELPPPPAEDRRRRSRTPGTGKSGREEWT
jgi:beta-N-acetylhexosaminidase